MLMVVLDVMTVVVPTRMVLLERMPMDRQLQITEKVNESAIKMINSIVSTFFIFVYRTNGKSFKTNLVCSRLLVLVLELVRWMVANVLADFPKPMVQLVQHLNSTENSFKDLIFYRFHFFMQLIF